VAGLKNKTFIGLKNKKVVMLIFT